MHILRTWQIRKSPCLISFKCANKSRRVADGDASGWHRARNDGSRTDDSVIADYRAWHYDRIDTYKYITSDRNAPIIKSSTFLVSSKPRCAVMRQQDCASSNGNSITDVDKPWFRPELSCEYSTVLSYDRSAISSPRGASHC